MSIDSQCTLKIGSDHECLDLSRTEEGAKDDKVIYIQAFLKKLEDEEKKEG